jgi:hypothetical protein
MDKHTELSGIFVLVNPNLKHDPANKKNQVGMIESADLENDTILVRFGTGVKVLFSADALLVLRNAAEIQTDLDNDATLLPFYDYYDIAQVLAFTDFGTKEYERLAVELAQKCPDVLEYTMVPLKQELAPKQQHYLGR